MEEGVSPPRWALDKKLGEDASMEEMSEGRGIEGGTNFMPQMRSELWSVISQMIKVEKNAPTRSLFIA